MASFKVEQQILNADYRKKVTDGIFSEQNLARKSEARRRFDVYKDNVVNYVREALQKEMGNSTCEEMLNRATNINIVKQIIDKRARVYQQEVKRMVTTPPEGKTVVQKILDAFSAVLGRLNLKPDIEAQTAQVQALEKGLDIGNTMKKANKWAELFKSVFIRVVPIPSETEPGKFTIRTDILHPGQYDVIEDPDDKTKPACVVFSDAIGSAVIRTSYAGALGQRGVNGEEIGEEQQDAIRKMNEASSKKSAVAQVGPTEQDRKDIRMIWWTRNYHFTTDGNGELIRNEENPENKNPIQMIPGVDVNLDQDARFWARGGQDIVDHCILLNLMLTDINYILKLQGNGIFTIIGPDAPKGQVTVGPDHALIIPTKAGSGGDTRVEYVSQNPNIDGHLNAIAQELALCISTNGLESSTVATNLDAANVTSGIQLAIEKSTVVGEIKDDEAFYRKVEEKLFKVIAKWVNAMIDGGEAIEAFNQIGKMDEGLRVSIEYQPPMPYYSEKELLEIVKMKKDLGFWQDWELLKMMMPSLSDEDAKKKMEEVKAENKAKQGEMIGKSVGIETNEGGEVFVNDEGKKPPQKKADDK